MAFRDRHRSQLLGRALTRSRRNTGIGARYDAAYFERWYRSPRTRVKSPAELKRQVAFVLNAAEWMTGRAVRTVLDVGCGEGQWAPALRRLRPSIQYTGVDPSTYAITRYGARRNLLLGSIETLDTMPLATRYDLVVCCGMLNYLSASQFKQGVGAVARRTGGLAYLEIFAKGDAIEGDVTWPALKAARWYREKIGASGLTPVGMQCWVPADAPNVAGMERAGE